MRHELVLQMKRVKIEIEYFATESVPFFFRAWAELLFL